MAMQESPSPNQIRCHFQHQPVTSYFVSTSSDDRGHIKRVLIPFFLFECYRKMRINGSSLSSIDN